MAHQQPTYKSEIFIPVRKDTQSFEERQKSIWDDMNTRMAERRRLWETEVERMRKDFFRLSPTESDDFLRPLSVGNMRFDDIFADIPKLGSPSAGDPFSSRSITSLDPISTKGGVYTEAATNSPAFKRAELGKVDADNKRFVVSFDVNQFSPEEISVRTQDNKLVVHAKHDEHVDGRSFSREFSREVDVPRNVNPLALQCTLSSDGILQIEAPVLVPSYESISSSSTPSPTIIQQQHQQLLQHQNGKSSPSPTTTIITTQQVTGGNMQKGSNLVHEDSSKTYKISLDMGSDYDPGDINIKTVNRRLIVTARHEDKAPGRTTSREFSREFDLPEFIDPNTVTASMSDTGSLIIEAPISSQHHGSYTAKPGSTKQPQMTISFT